MFRLGRQVWKTAYSPVVINSSKDIFSCVHHHHPRCLNISCVSFKDNVEDPAKVKEEKKKKSLYITLIGPDGKISTSTMEAANKLSKRRDLKLVKVSDSDKKTQNPVYKLLSSTHILGEDIQHKKQNKGKSTGFKSEKIVSFTHKISEHDIKSKVKQIIKWLEKKHEVRATISGSAENSLAENVFSTIETELKNNGRILQKRTSGTDIKFTIIPPKEETHKIETPQEIVTEKSELNSDKKKITSLQQG